MKLAIILATCLAVTTAAAQQRPLYEWGPLIIPPDAVPPVPRMDREKVEQAINALTASGEYDRAQDLARRYNKQFEPQYIKLPGGTVVVNAQDPRKQMWIPNQ
jgi:hypothetical protein